MRKGNYVSEIWIIFFVEFAKRNQKEIHRENGAWIGRKKIKGKSMKERIKQRIQSLREEYEAGLKMEEELETKKANLRVTLLRISGAIQVLEEVIAEPDSEEKGEGEQPSDNHTENEPLGHAAE